MSSRSSKAKEAIKHCQGRDLAVCRHKSALYLRFCILAGLARCLCARAGRQLAASFAFYCFGTEIGMSTISKAAPSNKINRVLDQYLFDLKSRSTVTTAAVAAVSLCSRIKVVLAVQGR
jgi:hypothetical protein